MRSILNSTTKAPYAIWQSINDTFSFFQQKASNIFYDEQPFFIKAQSDIHYQKYQDWCSDLRLSLVRIKNELRHENIENASLIFKEMLERKIISPIYFQQCLQGLEQMTQKKFHLSAHCIDEVKKVSEQFRNQLKTDQKVAKHYFYQDVVNQIIQLSGLQISARSFIRQLSYYQGLVPIEIYDSVITLLKQFIEQHFQTISSFSQNIYLEKVPPARYYEALITSIHKIFSEQENNVEFNKESKIAVEKQTNISSVFNFLKQHPGVLFTTAIAFSFLYVDAQRTESEGFSAQFNLSSVEGSDGFIVYGDNYALLGYAVGSGDLNGDGISDVILGAPNDFNHVGSVFVIFGTEKSFPTSIQPASLNGANGFRINGEQFNNSFNNFCAFGSVVASGDINNDGIADCIVGASEASPNNITLAGAVYVIFGHKGAFSPVIEVSMLDGTNGFAIHGSTNYTYTGFSVSSGDINADGIVDVIIGAGNYGLPYGSLGYVVFGHDGNFSKSLVVSELNGTNGFTLSETLYPGIYNNVASGDINGDEIVDLFIINDNVINGSINKNLYVAYGNSGNFPSFFDVTTLNGGNGFIVNTTTNYTSYGYYQSISGGDINADGVSDLILGIDSCNSTSEYYVGCVYIIFGQLSNFPSPFQIESLNGMNGFTIYGSEAMNYLGSAVAVGDVNGDDIKDLIIGAAEASPNNISSAGSVYVVYGHKDPYPESIEISSLANGVNGFMLFSDYSQGQAGFSVSSGDINGDGIGDIIIGVPHYTSPYSSGYSGAVYVVFGQRSHSSSSNNSNQRIIAVMLLGTGACLLVTCIGGAVYLAVKKPWLRKTQTQYQPIEQIKYPIRQDKGHTIIDGKYALLTRINRQEAQELLQATGIHIPFDRKKQRIKIPLLGKVSLARHVENNEFIAVKKIIGEEQIEHAKQQVALQQELNQEINILHLIDVIEASGSQGQLKLYQFMPLITFGNGRKFQNYLHEIEDNHLQMKLIVHVARQLLIGINNMHKHAIYHLNMNPSNFMLDDKGNLYVIDFNCAVKAVENSFIQSDKGSVFYFSPERLAHYREIGTTTFDAAKADSWAIGITLLEILINRYPFELNENSDPIRDWDQNFFNQELQKNPLLVEPQANSIWSLIKGLLELDVNKRLSIAEALLHSMFTNEEYCFHSTEEQQAKFLEFKRTALQNMSGFETDMHSLSNIGMSTFVDDENYNNQIIEEQGNNNETQIESQRQNIYQTDMARFTKYGRRASTQLDMTRNNYNNIDTSTLKKSPI